MFSLIIYILTAAIGFMMGFVYKRTHTTSDFFNPDPKKAMRLFMILFSVAIIATLSLSLFAPYSLHTTTIPEEGMLKFNSTKSIMIFAINLFFLVLVVFANAYSQALKRIGFISYLLAFGYYALFVLADAYYITDYFTLWQRSLQVFQGNLADYQNTGWIKCGLAFMVTTFNAAIIWWGLRK
jgi:hypothetical protein